MMLSITIFSTIVGDMLPVTAESPLVGQQIKKLSSESSETYSKLPNITIHNL